MNIIYKVQTDKNFEQAIEDLKNSLAKYKFGVLWELNIKDKLEEKGVEFEKNFHILEVCNPEKAKQVLEECIDVGYFLPCKMVVYEDDGATYIGMPKPTELIGMFNNVDLTDIAVEVESELISAINAAK